jgi:hypothetical protein
VELAELGEIGENAKALALHRLAERAAAVGRTHRAADQALIDLPS